MKKLFCLLLACFLCANLLIAPYAAAIESSLPEEPSSSLSSPESSEDEVSSFASSATSESTSSEQESGAIPSQSSVSSSRTNKPSVSSSLSSPFQWTDQLDLALNNADKWLSLNSSTEHYLITAGISGKTENISIVTRKIAEITDRNGQYSSPQQLEQDILGIVYSSLNPTEFNNMNLIDILSRFPGMESLPLRVNAYALICYDSNNFSVSDDCVNSRAAIIRRILSCQKADGGFGADALAGSSDISSTACALLALSGYADDPTVQTSIQNGLTYFQRCQRSNGTFSSNHQPGSCSELSGVICALCSLSISPSDPRFIKNNRDLSDVLLEFQSDNGGFCEHQGEQSSSSATEACIIALVGMQRMANPFILQNNVSYQPDSSGQNGVYMIIVIAATVLIAAAASVVIIWIVRRRGTSRRRDRNPKQRK